MLEKPASDIDKFLVIRWSLSLASVSVALLIDCCPFTPFFSFLHLFSFPFLTTCSQAERLDMGVVES